MTTKMSRAAIARRHANGNRCAVCGEGFPPESSSIKYCSSKCSGEALHRRANDPARVAERFWKKVDRDGPTMPHMPTPCWEWTSTRDRKGYGHISFASVKHGFKNRTAHRVSWWLHHGTWPEPMALHRCDNPACVRPDHLFEGDVVANFLDMRAKGRIANGSAVLTPDDVRAIRAALAAGERQADLARRYGVKFSVIAALKHGRTWRHVA